MGAFVDSLAAAGVARIEHITGDTLSRYVDREHKRGVCDATINRTVQVARALARWAATRTPPLCDEGALARWKNLREVARNADPLIPSPAEWATLVRELEREPPTRTSPATRGREVANARGLAVLVAVAVQTGLRIDELRHLRPEDIGADVVRVRACGGRRIARRGTSPSPPAWPSSPASSSRGAPPPSG
jgi:integrase